MSVHPHGRCAFCGATSRQAPLRSIVFQATRTRTWACRNTLVCMRRRKAKAAA